LPQKTATFGAISMKNNLGITVLLGILALSAISSAVLCWQFIAKSRELRQLQSHVAFINNRRAAVNLLVTDTLKYSERNPAIDPILQAAGLKSAKTGTGTNAPKTPAQ
jgi:hypothetical protein